MTTPIRASYETIRNIHRFIPREDIPAMITNVCKNPCTRIIPGTEVLSFSEKDNRRIFSVRKDLQEKINFAHARKEIVKHLELPAGTEILQVIGDCIPFSRRGTERARGILASILEQLEKSDQLLLWGYTGSKKDDGRRLDINHLLNDWIDARDARGNRVLANVLDVDTPRALTEWNCHGAQTAKNFYLVYGGAKFGEEIVSSDSITDKACCFDGGIQSFRQMMNLLMREVPIQCYYGLRNERDMHNLNPTFVQRNRYFSAVEFIKFMRDNIQEYYAYNGLREREVPETMEIVNDFLELWKDDYLTIYPLYNPELRDASNRQALFQAGWNLFLEKQLWRKLNLCQFSAI